MTYEYECRECGHEFDVDKSMDRAGDPETCPECGGPGRRLYSAVPFRFGGAGRSCSLGGSCASCGRSGHGTG